MFGSSFTCIAVAFSFSIFFFLFVSVWKEVGNGSVAIVYSCVTVPFPFFFPHPVHSLSV